MFIIFLSDTMDLTDDESHPPRPSSIPGPALFGLDRSSSMNNFEVTSSTSSNSNGENSIKETNTVPISVATPTSATPTFLVTSCQSSDMDGGSHSSEEELEEINNIPLLPNSQGSSSSSTSTTPPEATPMPVEFSTTPPNHVHKPRRSTSPPPCIPLVHEANICLPRHSSDSCRGGEECFTQTFSPALSGCHATSLELKSHDGNSIDRRNSLVVERRAIASKKRYKQSRIHHIQRPCLDFEKMQLVSESHIILPHSPYTHLL